MHKEIDTNRIDDGDGHPPSPGPPPTHETLVKLIEQQVNEKAELKLKLFEQELEEKLHRTVEEAHNEFRTCLDEKMREQDERFRRMEEAQEEMKAIVEKQALDEGGHSVLGSFQRSMFGRVASTLALNDKCEGCLDEDTFSLMMVSKVYSQSWVLAWVSL